MPAGKLLFDSTHQSHTNKYVGARLSGLIRQLNAGSDTTYPSLCLGPARTLNEVVEQSRLSVRLVFQCQH